MWCYVCCCCQSCTSLELQVIFKVCWEFLLKMGLWADFVSDRFWICVLALSRGTPWQAMTLLPQVCWWPSPAFGARTGMSKNRHWSKRSWSGWPKEKGKQPVRPRKGTALMRRGREQPSWWVTNPLLCFHAGQAKMALLEGINLMSLVWWTWKLGFRLKHLTSLITKHLAHSATASSTYSMSLSAVKAWTMAVLGTALPVSGSMVCVYGVLV